MATGRQAAGEPGGASGMVDRSASFAASEAHTAVGGSGQRVRPEAVTVLERLLGLLFPNPPSLDCITIDDVQRRYRLTGLGAPALAAIEQSQRLVRARGDYAQTGLCEFHIGLIYFHWDDPRAAANQFALARQPWLLADDHSATCLAHFAQGLALYHAFHNEPAMLQFGRAERLLARDVHGPQAARQATLVEHLRPLLTAAQEALRESLWPADRPPEAPAAPPERLYVPVPPARDSAPQPPVAKSDSAARRAFERPPPPLDRSTRALPPISNLPGGLGDVPRGPVPGHIVVDDRFGWYVIAERRGSFLPAVVAGTWLLADSEPDERPAARGEYVIVGSRRAGLGSIAVQPISRSSVVPHVYLGYRAVGPDGAARILLDDSPGATTDDAQVLAVVEGFWQVLDGQLADKRS